MNGQDKNISKINEGSVLKTLPISYGMNKYRTSFFFLLFSALISLAVLHLTGIYFSLYWKFLWFDVVVHFLAGLWVGGTVLWLLYLSGYFKLTIPRKITIFSLSLGAALFVGAMWEIFEVWIGATLLADPRTYRIDTVIDILADVTGAFAIALYFNVKK